MLYKRHQYNLKQIRIILERNNLTVAKADKGKTIVIINRDLLLQKFDSFIQNSNMLQLNKDPTEQISQLLHFCFYEYEQRKILKKERNKNV
jgi:hypothetical protein